MMGKSGLVASRASNYSSEGIFAVFSWQGASR